MERGGQISASREALPSQLISCLHTSPGTIQLLWLWLQDEQEVEEEGCFHAHGSSTEPCPAVLAPPLANSSNPGSPFLQDLLWPHPWGVTIQFFLHFDQNCL